MCLLVVASRIVPAEPLIVGANRDEVLDRPSTPVTVLSPGPPRVVGGRDELSGGTWLAVNRDGVCAGLTNQPLGDAKDPTRRSRGELPLVAVRFPTAREGVERLEREVDPADYNGAWLLVGDRTSLWFVDVTGAQVRAVELPPGIHVLENRAVDTASAKVDLVREGLGDLVGMWSRSGPDHDSGSGLDGDTVEAAFRRVLADHRIPEGDERPNSANCVHLDGFGTRSSCVVRIASGAHADGAGPAPRMWVADGPPCTTTYTDVSALWAERPPGRWTGGR
jgi:uncharacterized protein with NRDE domain